MVRRMRARLQKFLPIVLLALAMQVLAPIAACWAAGQAVADPLGAGVREVLAEVARRRHGRVEPHARLAVEPLG